MKMFPLLPLAALAVAACSVSAARAQSTVYVCSLPCSAIQGRVGFKANGIDQLGGYINFVGTDRYLTSAVVQMASQTTVGAGAPYQLSLTLSFYSVGANGAPGAFLNSMTQSFTIPSTPVAGTSAFFDAAFTFAGMLLPDSVIWTLGFDPGANGAPQNSLNVVVNGTAPTVGTAGNRDVYLSLLNDDPNPQFATIQRDTTNNPPNAIGAARFFAVPEPGVAVLAGVGLLALAVRARRRG